MDGWMDEWMDGIPGMQVSGWGKNSVQDFGNIYAIVSRNFEKVPGLDAQITGAWSITASRAKPPVTL
jgi:hypothetical protein